MPCLSVRITILLTIAADTELNDSSDNLGVCVDLLFEAVHEGVSDRARAGAFTIIKVKAWHCVLIDTHRAISQLVQADDKLDFSFDRSLQVINKLTTWLVVQGSAWAKNEH